MSRSKPKLYEVQAPDAPPEVVPLREATASAAMRRALAHLAVGEATTDGERTITRVSPARVRDRMARVDQRVSAARRRGE